MTTLQDLLASLPQAERDSVDAEYRALLRGIPLAELRTVSGLTQKEVAATLGTTQAAVSKAEARSDVLLSTLFSYARALGATAHINVSLKGKSFALEPSWLDDTVFGKGSCHFTLREDENVESNEAEGWTKVGIVKNCRPLTTFDLPPVNDDMWQSATIGYARHA